MQRPSGWEPKDASPAPGSLELVQAFLNTSFGRGWHEELRTPEQLHTWLVSHQLLLQNEPVTEGDLRRTRSMRDALRHLLSVQSGGMTDQNALRELNRVSKDAPLTIAFNNDGRADFAPDIGGVDGALARLLGIVMTAMIDGTWTRLKVCQNPGCERIFYDYSKNHSGRWCSMAKCGNRLNARAYRRRQHIDHSLPSNDEERVQG